VKVLHEDLVKQKESYMSLEEAFKQETVERGKSDDRHAEECVAREEAETHSLRIKSDYEDREMVMQEAYRVIETQLKARVENLKERERDLEEAKKVIAEKEEEIQKALGQVKMFKKAALETLIATESLTEEFEDSKSQVIKLKAERKFARQLIRQLELSRQPGVKDKKELKEDKEIKNFLGLQTYMSKLNVNEDAVPAKEDLTSCTLPNEATIEADGEMNWSGSSPVVVEEYLSRYRYPKPNRVSPLTTFSDDGVVTS